jgi:hypothetical protein
MARLTPALGDGHKGYPPPPLGVQYPGGERRPSTGEESQVAAIGIVHRPNVEVRLTQTRHRTRSRYSAHRLMRTVKALEAEVRRG